jgi:hypothetical protein
MDGLRILHDGQVSVQRHGRSAHTPNPDGSQEHASVIILGVSAPCRLFVVLLLLYPCLTLALQNQDYLPLTNREVGQPFALKKQGMATEGSLPGAGEAGPSGSRYRIRKTEDAGVLSLEGLDKSGKPWSVTVTRGLPES